MSGSAPCSPVRAMPSPGCRCSWVRAGKGAAAQQYSHAIIHQYSLNNNTSSPRSYLLLPAFLTCSPAPFLVPAVMLHRPFAGTMQLPKLEILSFFSLHWILLVQWITSAQRGGRGLLGWGEGSHGLPGRRKGSEGSRSASPLGSTLS